MRVFAGGLIASIAVLTASHAGAQEAALKPWPENPWYWSYHGEPVLLLGGSDDDNLFQWPEEKLIGQLDRIAKAGGNVIRNTMSDRKDRGFEVYPFRKLDSGKYDLNQWNPEYWARLNRLLRETARRNVFVQIEVWDRFDYTDNRASDPRRWQDHPYSPANNVNYTFDESGFERRYPEHPGANKQPFFFTTPEQRNNTVVLPHQERFVNRLLDTSLQYDHVLYCIDNETKAEPEWGEYWARLIKRRAAEAGKTVMVTEMWDDWDLKAERHRQTFDRPELYDFVDVSQNNHNSGQVHWDNFLYVRNYLSDHPRPMNTTKTYGADGNKFKHTDQDAIERFWRHLLAGGASIRFHRPPSGLGINDKAAACLRAARLVEQRCRFWNLEPANDLLGEREPNEAYCAATDDRGTLVVFFPRRPSKQRSSVTLEPGPSLDNADLRWVDIDSGSLAGEAGGARLKGNRLTSPGDGNYAAVLTTAARQ
jgi:hypothetical protein